MQYYRDYSSIIFRENDGYVNEKQFNTEYTLWKPLF